MDVSTPKRDSVVVLLVEDNPGDVRLIREGFDAVEFDVVIHAVTTCTEAVEFLNERAEGSSPYPDLLLLDLNLPKENGFALLQTLEDSSRLPPLPVLVLTSSKTEEDVTRSYALHASAYVTKPNDPAEYVSIAQAIRDFWFETVRLPPA